MAPAVVKVSRDTTQEVDATSLFCHEERASQKKSKNYFLQNEANIVTQKHMHDNASYQLLSLDGVVIGFSVGYAPPSNDCAGDCQAAIILFILYN